jgi:hypothetical protein
MDRLIKLFFFFIASKRRLLPYLIFIAHHSLCFSILASLCVLECLLFGSLSIDAFQVYLFRLFIANFSKHFSLVSKIKNLFSNGEISFLFLIFRGARSQSSLSVLHILFGFMTRFIDPFLQTFKLNNISLKLRFFEHFTNSILSPTNYTCLATILVSS